MDATGLAATRTAAPPRAAGEVRSAVEVYGDPATTLDAIGSV